ncbi:hypothetical protein EYV94_10725 [Puteibacter caeruleilacunae]|nr:hypothetical protein EYV94_10725 [Puteibacter caeruleilacunae]
MKKNNRLDERRNQISKDADLFVQHPFSNALKAFEQAGIRKTALNLIRKGYDNSVIVDATGLSIDQIEKLRKEAK